jgi:hypothetical protein
MFLTYHSYYIIFNGTRSILIISEIEGRPGSCSLQCENPQLARVLGDLSSTTPQCCTGSDQNIYLLDLKRSREATEQLLQQAALYQQGPAGAAIPGAVSALRAETARGNSAAKGTMPVTSSKTEGSVSTSKSRRFFPIQ